MGRIQSFDYRILTFIQRRLRCSVLDRTMPLVSAIGNNGILWIVTAFLFLCIPSFRQCGLAMIGALIICGIICNLVLKPVVARYRPCHNMASMPLLIRRPFDYSFPSGHTISSFTAATVLFHFHTQLGIVAFVIASLIAFSRVYLFVHYPTDVLVGIFLGITFAWGVVFLNQLIRYGHAL